MYEIKVAIIEPVGGHGGMHYYDFGLAKGLLKAQVEPILYTCNSTAQHPDFKVKTTFNNIFGKAPKLIRAIRFIQGLLASFLDINQNNIKIVHFHFFHITYLEWLCIIFAKFFNKKIIITIHDIQSFSGDQNQKLVQFVYKNAHKIIVHNQFSYNTLIEYLDFIKIKTHIIPHGNFESIAKIDKSQARKALSLPEHAFIFLFFGQIKKVKGLDILLQAFTKIVKQDIHLIIAGKVWKDDFNIYQEIIDKNNLHNNLTAHIYYISDQQVPLYYHAADTIVLPYREIYQSGVLLMAMSYQLPVIVSNLPAMVEIIQDQYNGFVFTKENPDALAEKMLEVVNKKAYLEEIINNAHQTIQEKYNWERIGELTKVVYKLV